jgi:hypothetical protein
MNGKKLFEALHRRFVRIRGEAAKEAVPVLSKDIVADWHIHVCSLGMHLIGGHDIPGGLKRIGTKRDETHVLLDREKRVVYVSDPASPDYGPLDYIVVDLELAKKILAFGDLP